MRDVPMMHAHPRAGHTAERLAERLGNHHRPMPAAGTSNRDRQIALSFCDVLRNQKLQQISQPRQQLAGSRGCLP